MSGREVDGLSASDDPLFFLDEAKMVRTAALVATALTSLRRLELISRSQQVHPEALDGFGKLADEAIVIRQRLARDREPILNMIDTDPAARRLVERAETMISQLDELIALVASLRAGQMPGDAVPRGDHLRRP
jgi:hypothetical protein